MGADVPHVRACLPFTLRGKEGAGNETCLRTRPYFLILHSAFSV